MTKIQFLLLSLVFSNSILIGQVTWEPFTGIYGDADVNGITISPTGVWYIAGGSDLYSSPDSGKTWMPETKFGYATDIKTMRFLDDGTPILGTNNPPRMVIKRNGTWVTEFFANDFETYLDTLYGIKSGEVKKSYDRGLNWTTHLKIPGTSIYRYRRHNGRHYIEYANGVNRRFGEVKLDGTIIQWEYSQLSGYKMFFIDDCDNIHFLYEYSQSTIFSDGTEDGQDFNFIKGKYSPYKNRIYRLVGDYLYGNLNCGVEWEYLGEFKGAKEIHAIGVDTIMITFEKYVSVVKLPDIELLHQPIQNAEFFSWDRQEIPDGTRFLQVAPGDYRIRTDGTKELLDVDMGFLVFAPNGWIYQDYPDIPLKQVVSKDAGVTWDTIPKPAAVLSTFNYVYPITEEIIAYSSFDGTIISFADGSTYSLPADTVLDLDHFYNQYQVIGDIILMKGNQPPSITAFDITTREFHPQLILTGDHYWSRIDAEGTLFSLDEEEKILTVRPYPYSDVQSVVLPSGIFEGATEVDKGYLVAHAHALYHFSKDLVMTNIPLGPMENEQLGSITYTKSGKWLAGTFSKLQGAYISTDSVQTGDNRVPVSGRIFTTNEVCEPTGTISSANWKFHFKNSENEYLAVGQTRDLFSFNLPAGDYDVKVVPPPYSIFQECQWPVNLSVVENNPILNWNISSQLSSCEAATVSVSAPFYRRCFESAGFITIRNVGGFALAHPTVTMNLGSHQNITFSSFAYMQHENEYTFLLDDIEPGETIKIPFKVYTSCEVPLGQELCMYAIVSVQDKCAELNYKDACCMAAIGSWDPNDKQVTNDDGLDITQFGKDEWLNYKIRFQNTGTDTAFTVKLVDRLDPWLDLLTFEMVSSSHDCTYHFEEDRNLVVDLKDIRLPDSTTNLLASSGYFEFRIKADSAFTFSDSISNAADIYFDFNDAVVTNTVTSQLKIETGVGPQPSDHFFRIDPNPASDFIRISFIEHPTEDYRISILDLQGRELNSSTYNMQESIISLDGLSPGLYLLKILQGDFLAVKKFVKVLRR